ncbi:MAG: prefoldin subunit alpha [Promethearchaeota archaeon]
MSQSVIPDEVVTRVKNLQEENDQLQVNIGAIEQQINLFYRAMNSLNDAIMVQNELKSKKTGDEILIPIGGSNYIQCTLKDPHKTFISLGSGVSLLTELVNSEEQNKSQIQNLEKSLNQLQEQHSKLSKKLNSNRQELLGIVQKYQLL